jgi:hypothetical protein
MDRLPDSTVYADRKQDGRVLFAIAYENHRLRTAGHVYIHAMNAGEAMRKVLASNAFQKDTRIVAIAPAIGVLAELDERDNLKGQII